VADPLDSAVNDREPVQSLKVDHSSRKRENALRQGLAPSLLAVRASNEAHGNDNAEFFEIAQVYWPRADRPMPDEPARLALVSGRDVLGLKGVLESLLARLHPDGPLETQATSHAMLRPGRAAELLLGGTHLGFVGEVHPDWAERLGLRSACSLAELSFDLLMERATLVPQYQPLPAYPGVSRDLSIVVDRGLPWSELASAVRQAAGADLEALSYFDTFEGGNVPSGRHSLHFGLRFRNPQRTLTGEEVDQAMQAVIAACRSRFAADLRG
jgi:phenylalanyl-tRNA synthetase beta chain